MKGRPPLQLTTRPAVSLDLERLRRCYATTREHLLSLRNDRGHWEGELSTSPLSTATAVMALEMVRKRLRVEGEGPRAVDGSTSAPGTRASRPHERGDDPASGGRKPPVDVTDEFTVQTGESNAAGQDATRTGEATRTGGSRPPLAGLIAGGLEWLAAHQNPDGGWGDTTKSVSNISTSMLARAVFKATGTEEEYADVVERAVGYIDRIGGVDAVLKRYGKDRTFSIPILTHCALAGLVEWKRVLPLPFEMACIPAKFYKTVRLPVVSYALPALIAIGQVRHHHRKPWNPLTRVVRDLARKPSLRVLERIQPTNGGFLEATPLTSFVTMSLAGMGLADHPVARKGLEFIVNSVRDDGSWPIDTNLATWVTTLSINALGDDLPDEARPALRDWLLDQQYQEVHPYTNADPGGWAWTNLPGGVPDADDTPGAILALIGLEQSVVSGQRSAVQPDCHAVRPERGERVEDNGGMRGDPASENAAPASGGCQPPGYASNGEPTRETGSSETGGLTPAARRAVENGVRWLLSLQNVDGGFPTFCRGWANLPFDRSSADITAHCLRAIASRLDIEFGVSIPPALRVRWKAGAASRKYRPLVGSAIAGFHYLDRVQRPDGSWYPLWFGNQFDAEEENPTYGTAKVLAAYRDCGRIETGQARRGLEWLRANQNDDGGWGGRKGIFSSVEETALATELLVSVEPEGEAAKRGVAWLLDRVEWREESGEGRDGDRRQGVGLDASDSQRSTLNSQLNWTEPTPIGFYFAKLWYFEELYPIAFTVGALRRAVAAYVSRSDDVTEPTTAPTSVRETP